MFDRIKAMLRPAPWLRAGEGRPVDVGWLLDADEARFIWPDPRRIRRKRSRADACQVGQLLPLRSRSESRMYEVPCPIDVQLRFARDDKGVPTLVNADGDRSSIRNKHLNQMLAPADDGDRRRRPTLR